MSRAYELLRACRGPLVLITLGFLFLLDQADRLPFHRSWPVVIIVFGFLKLIERSIAPPLAPAVSPLSPGAPQRPETGGMHR